MWAAPAVGTPRAISEAWRPQTARGLTIEVLEARIIDGDLWFRVRLDAAYGCGGATEALPIEEGWIPGYSRTGENVVWFYSRGC